MGYGGSNPPRRISAMSNENLKAKNYKLKAIKGFTLIELLVVIAIISLLSSIVLASLSQARTKAKVAATVSQIRQLYNSIALYISDTDIYPPSDCDADCVEATDPLASPLGVSGWNGPYRPSFHNLTHNWGGVMSYAASFLDFDGDNTNDYIIDLDDDRPGMGGGDNGAKIPVEALRMIDDIIDDGNLNTGYARGLGDGGTGMGATLGNGSDAQWEILSVEGELFIKLPDL